MYVAESSFAKDLITFKKKKKNLFKIKFSIHFRVIPFNEPLKPLSGFAGHVEFRYTGNTLPDIEMYLLIVPIIKFLLYT